MLIDMVGNRKESVTVPMIYYVVWRCRRGVLPLTTVMVIVATPSGCLVRIH